MILSSSPRFCDLRPSHCSNRICLKDRAHSVNDADMDMIQRALIVSQSFVIHETKKSDERPVGRLIQSECRRTPLEQRSPRGMLKSSTKLFTTISQWTGALCQVTITLLSFMWTFNRSIKRCKASVIRLMRQKVETLDCNYITVCYRPLEKLNYLKWNKNLNQKNVTLFEFILIIWLKLVSRQLISRHSEKFILEQIFSFHSSLNWYYSGVNSSTMSLLDSGRLTLQMQNSCRQRKNEHRRNIPTWSRSLSQEIMVKRGTLIWASYSKS